MSRKKHYAPRVPHAAAGFRAQELRNVPKGAWWARRWFEAIEALRLGARGGRGRQYAEAGQVASLSVSGGHVEARVVGARPDPYLVKIDFAPISGAAEAFGARDPMPVGRVLAGDLPVSAGRFAVGPQIGRDTFWCSCPDWSKPCKHLAAVLYLLGDAMIRDPALVLRLRGCALPAFEPAAMPLWKGSVRFAEAIDRIRRRVAAAERKGWEKT